MKMKWITPPYLYFLLTLLHFIGHILSNVIAHMNRMMHDQTNGKLWSK